MRSLKLEAALRRNYGASEISFSISEIVDVEGSPGIRAAYDSLIVELNSQHDYYASQWLHQTPATLGEGDRDKPSGANEFHEVSKITKKVDGGAVNYRIHCGHWQKFGALVYPEIVARYGIAEMFGLTQWEVCPPDLYAKVDTTGKSPKVTHIQKG